MVLNRDRETYGVDTYTIRSKDIGPFQHAVEEVMDASAEPADTAREA